MRTPKTYVEGLNHWIITRDLLAELKIPDGSFAKDPKGTNCNAPGMMSNHCTVSFDKDSLQSMTGKDASQYLSNLARGAGLTQKFRISDDDNEIYYEGYMMPFDMHSDESDGFEPLDDFAMPNAGATNLEYWQDGKWEML